MKIKDVYFLYILGQRGKRNEEKCWHLITLPLPDIFFKFSELKIKKITPTTN